MARPTRVEVIPVPRGMTVEDAYAEMTMMGRLVEYRWWRLRFRWPFVKWYVVVVYDEEDV